MALADSGDRAPSGRHRGCLLALGGLVVAVAVAAWRPLYGVPLVVLAGMAGLWAIALRSALNATELPPERERLRTVAAARGDVWRALLSASGLGDLVDELAPRARWAVRLGTAPVESLPVGASRLGGEPDLPGDLKWPRRNGTPMAFVAQLDLAEVAAVLPENPLPETGHLWFFYDAASGGWGVDAGDEGSAVVLHRASALGLRAAEAPPALPRASRFKPCAIALEAYQDIPDDEEDESLPSRLRDPARLAVYREIRAYLAAGNAADPHKLLGFADPLQGAMEDELPGPGGWRLLLQLESDSHACMSWGDEGTLYFWIREADLRSARFDRVWAVLQCH
jgi:hypothetical protein